MLLLMLFAFLAGAATAVSPCALPVLPVVFAAGVTGGRRRPLGIATGLAVSFSFAVVVLVYVLSALGLPDDLLRTFAIAVLLVFGLSLLTPKAADWVEFQISKLTSRGAGRIAGATQEQTAGKEGFWSGFLVGAGLGFVYAPCAGPILAGVITATASQPFSTQRLLVAMAYGVGSAVMFFALMLGGRRLIAPLMQRSQKIQFAMGLAMVFVAVAMFVNLDTRFQTAIADELPSALVNPTEKLEKTKAVQDDLADARGSESKFAEPEQKGTPSSLPVLGEAPDFTGTQQWFNTPGGEKLSLADLRGKVVLVDFWTYTCINCIRTQPYIKSWWAKYKDKGFVVVGVHTPEFPFERKASNVEGAIRQAKITYPVAQDNKYRTWDAYSNQYWPAHYLIDAKGRVRATHFGEGEYKRTERQIRSLLREAGDSKLGGEASASGVVKPSTSPITPETYLGARRAGGWIQEVREGFHDYGSPPRALKQNLFAYSGSWRIGEDNATALAADSRIDVHFRARRVYLVLGSPGRSRSVGVELDGKPIRASAAGRDVNGGVVTVKGQRLYNLVSLKSTQDHRLTLRVAPGINGFAFTFG